MIEKHATDDARKCVLSCPNGRMVVLEQVDEEKASNDTLAEMARAGKDEGYAIFTETSDNGLLPGGAPGLFLSILVRPGILAARAGILSAVAAVAAARAIEKVGDIEVSIRCCSFAEFLRFPCHAIFRPEPCRCRLPKDPHGFRQPCGIRQHTFQSTLCQTS